MGVTIEKKMGGFKSSTEEVEVIASTSNETGKVKSRVTLRCLRGLTYLTRDEASEVAHLLDRAITVTGMQQKNPVFKEE